MKKIIRYLAVFSAVIIIGVLGMPSKSMALYVAPVSMELYSTSATPVYAVPDVFTPVVIYLERFQNVRVTGITDNGFFQVDLGGVYYIPGAYLVADLEKSKNDEQKKLDYLRKMADAYRIQLENMASYSDKFTLKDVTGDGFPELFDAAGKEIYTYYNPNKDSKDEDENKGRAVMMYFSEYPLTFYYSKKDNKLLGKYKWKDKDYWEVYDRDVTFLPWGQFRCISTDASAYKGNASSVSWEFYNNAERRAELYEILQQKTGIKENKDNKDNTDYRDNK